MKKFLLTIFSTVFLFHFAALLSSCESNFPTIPPITSSNKIVLTVNGQTFDISLYDNETAAAFKKMLPLTLEMSAMAHEKFYNLAENLPTSPQHIGKINEGDIMLYGSNCLVLFYETFNSSYSYTRIGRIDNTKNLVEALGLGIVKMNFSF